MRRLSSYILTGFIALGLVLPAVGRAAKSTPTPTPTPTPKATPQVPQVSKDDAERLARLKVKAANEITRRTEILVKLNDRVGKMVFLRDNDRKVLKEQIAAEQKSLADLLVKIQAANLTLAQMRSYVVVLNTEYRQFSVVGPKVALMIGVDHLGFALEKFDAIEKELVDKSDELKRAKKLKSTTETKIADLKNKIDDARVKYEVIYKAVLPIQPTDFAAIKGQLQSQRDTLKASYESLVKALATARSIKVDLESTK